MCVCVSQAIRKAAHTVGEIDGVLTFCELAVPLASRLAEKLGLPHNPPAAVDAARDKVRGTCIVTHVCMCVYGSATQLTRSRGRSTRQGVTHTHTHTNTHAGRWRGFGVGGFDSGVQIDGYAPCAHGEVDMCVCVCACAARDACNAGEGRSALPQALPYRTGVY